MQRRSELAGATRAVSCGHVRRAPELGAPRRVGTLPTNLSAISYVSLSYNPLVVGPLPTRFTLWTGPYCGLYLQGTSIGLDRCAFRSAPPCRRGGAWRRWQRATPAEPSPVVAL